MSELDDITRGHSKITGISTWIYYWMCVAKALVGAVIQLFWHMLVKPTEHSTISLMFSTWIIFIGVMVLINVYGFKFFVAGTYSIHGWSKRLYVMCILTKVL